MKIRLNNKKFEIPTAENLTVGQYIELSKFDKLNVANYLAVVTGRRVLEIATLKMKDKNLRRLLNYIGNISDFKELQNLGKSAKTFIFDNKVYTKSFDWQTVGVRLMLEKKAEQTNEVLELATYLLAILISKNFDADKIEKNYIKLLEYSYIDILPFAIFFFKKLNRGYSKELPLLQRLRKIIRMRIQMK
ncbi:MAG: hypothetical protein DRI95_00645 [Bacteroidetes bacterium]|nr:MAG: hypothetical protein DRI95_00645 [Bacteroidota bacterium]